MRNGPLQSEQITDLARFSVNLTQMAPTLRWARSVLGGQMFLIAADADVQASRLEHAVMQLLPCGMSGRASVCGRGLACVRSGGRILGRQVSPVQPPGRADLP
jgi:hypothetical protein